MVKIRRPIPRPSLLSTKVLAIAFIAAVSVFASLNLSPNSFSSGLPLSRIGAQEFETTTVNSYKNEHGADVVEHDFISLVDPAEQDGAKELDTELAAEEEERRLDQQEVEAFERQEQEENAEQLEQLNDDLANFNTEEEETAEQDPLEAEQEQEIKKEESIKEYKNKKSSSGSKGTTKTDGSDKYHVIVTVSEGIYVQWQARMVRKTTAAISQLISFSLLTFEDRHHCFKRLYVFKNFSR
jgi:flagellar biosynthesis GTPase FlhF